MNLQEWERQRKIPTTAAGFAYAAAKQGRPYTDMPLRARRFYMLEFALALGGDYTATAKKIGVHRNTVSNAMRTLDLTNWRVRALAAELKGGIPLQVGRKVVQQ